MTAEHALHTVTMQVRRGKVHLLRHRLVLRVQ
jgi:hypothetical protein